MLQVTWNGNFQHPKTGAEASPVVIFCGDSLDTVKVMIGEYVTAMVCGGWKFVENQILDIKVTEAK